LANATEVQPVVALPINLFHPDDPTDDSSELSETL
jgi:hypothetical protein